jgi:alanyl-tRNA synthetase
VVACVFQEDTQPEYLGFFATEIAKTEKAVALLARTSSGDLVFAQHPLATKDMNLLLRQVLQELGGKGGGSREFARGKLSDGARVVEAIARAKELVAK